jgi:two-component system aerobic respiration control sensor histidine kinase ArcB
MFYDAELVEQLFLRLPNYIFWKNSQSIYQGCNYNFLKLLGLTSPKQIIGHTDDEIPELKNLVQKTPLEDRSVLNNGKAIKGKKIKFMLGKNEEKIFLLDKIPLQSKKSKIMGIMGILTDITDREKLNIKLDQAMQIQKAYMATLNREVTGQVQDEMTVGEYADELRNYLESIIACMPGNVYWLNKECILLGGNNNLLNMFGLKSRAELIGLNYDQMANLAHWTKEQAQSFRQAELEVMATGVPKFNIEEAPIIINGETRYYVANKVPLFNKQKEVIGIVGISTDITERKLAELALHRAKELAETAHHSKSQFIANMSHDIRTPLTGLVGMGKIIQQYITNPTGKEAAYNLVNAAHILLELLNSVIEFSKLEIGELPVYDIKFNMEVVLDEIVKLIMPSAQEKNLNLAVKNYKKIPKCLIGDKVRIHRILLNLVGNAIKFTHKGKVEISVNLVKQVGKNIILKMLVKDTGIGMPEDKQEIIFSKFSRLTPSYTGIYKGYGLGLSIVKQFISEIDGEIDVQSIEGKGSTFACTIPLKQSLLEEDSDTKGAEENPEIEASNFDIVIKDFSSVSQENFSIQAEKVSTKLPKQSESYKILLVEDDKLAQLIAAHILKEAGSIVEIADNAKTALALAKKNTYDLIFMDIGLPDKSGCEVTNEIRAWEKKKKKNTPIVALTAHIDNDSKQQCLKVGMDEVLTKPLDEKKSKDIFLKYLNTNNRKIENDPPIIDNSNVYGLLR